MTPTQAHDTMPKVARAKVRAGAVERDPRWRAVRVRDASADGAFFYAVETTGVYCRPSCAARTPRPEHVSFHVSTAAAEHAGFRACKRCRPAEPPAAERHAALVAELCRFLEGRDEPPSLQELADRARLSPFHTHRLFKSVVGVTPRAYAAALRARKLRGQLRAARNVTEAIYGAGFSSASRFYDHAGDVLGMTPAKYRAGGAELAIRFAIAPCSLGLVLVAATERGVCAIALGDDPQALSRELTGRFPKARLEGGDAGFASLVRAVVRLVDAPLPGEKLPLDIRGTAFEQRVWNGLRAVPAGKTVSYSELARTIGAPKSARAVARACAANVLAVAIPCHRAVCADGELAGYRWGVERKRALLEREARVRAKHGS